MRFTPFILTLGLLAPLALTAPIPAPVTDKTKEHLAKCAATGLRYAGAACGAAAVYSGSSTAGAAGAALGLASIPFAVAEHRLNGQAIPEIKEGGYGQAIKACVGDACKAVANAVGLGGRPPANDVEMGRGSGASSPASSSYATAHSHQDRGEKVARDELTPLLGREVGLNAEGSEDDLN